MVSFHWKSEDESGAGLTIFYIINNLLLYAFQMNERKIKWAQTHRVNKFFLSYLTVDLIKLEIFISDQIIFLLS